MMTVSDIISNWKIDSKIAPDELESASLKVCSLQCKYAEMLIPEKIALKKLEQRHKKLVKIKTEYYLGKLSEEEHKELGLQQFNLKILRQDLPTYLEADDAIIASNIEVAEQSEKVDLLMSIIKTVMIMGFQIKNAIDSRKYNEGF